VFPPERKCQPLVSLPGGDCLRQEGEVCPKHSTPRDRSGRLGLKSYSTNLIDRLLAKGRPYLDAPAQAGIDYGLVVAILQPLPLRKWGHATDGAPGVGIERPAS